MRFLAADALGNIATDGPAAPPVLRFRRDAVIAEHRARKDGWRELEVGLDGSSIRLDRSGQKTRGATLHCEGGETRKLDKPLSGAFTVQLGRSLLRVKVPSLVGDTRDHRVHAAGLRGAHAIPVEHRVPRPRRRQGRGLHVEPREGLRQGEEDSGEEEAEVSRQATLPLPSRTGVVA